VSAAIGETNNETTPARFGAREVWMLWTGGWH